MMWGLLAGILWTVSLVTFPGQANGFWLPKDLAWLLGSFLLASSPWWNPPTRPTLRLSALGWLFCWILLSFAWYVLWPLATIPQAGVGVQRALNMRWYVSPILPTLTGLGSLLALDAMVRHTDSLSRWHRVALHLVRIGAVGALCVIGYMLGINPLDAILPVEAWHNKPVAFLGNATLVGNFLAIIAPLCLMFQARRYRIGVFSLLLVAIALTQSISSLVAVWIACLVVWIMQRRRLLILGTLLVGSLALWFLFHQSSETITLWLNPGGRLAMWQTALAFWMRQPLNAWIGYGAGSVGAATANGLWDYGFLHNDYLQWVFEFGLIGGLLALWLGCQLFSLLRAFQWTGASTAWLGAALAYLLLMLTSFPCQIGSCLMVGIVIAAAVLAHCQPPGVRHA